MDVYSVATDLGTMQKGVLSIVTIIKAKKRNMLQALKLSASATYLALSPKATKDWYKHRENFIEIEIPYKNE